MEALPHTLADLLDVASVASDGERGQVATARLLGAYEPSLLLLLDARGQVISRQDNQPGAHALAADAVAARLLEALGNGRVCELELETAAGPQAAFAVRLPDCAGAAILACVLPRTDRIGAPGGEIGTELVVCMALAWAENQNRDRLGAMSTRIEHLSAEHQMLKSSHAEAMAAAIEERERRLSEQRANTNRLQAVMMMAADGIVTVDQQGRIESINEAAGSIFDYSPDEVIGKNVSILMPMPHRLMHDAHIARYLQSGRGKLLGARREMVGRRRDGSTFPVELSVSEVLLDERRIFTGIVRDITERKRAEQELERLHLQNEMILNSVAEGIFGLDAKGLVVFLNPAGARMLAWTSEEAIGKPYGEVFHRTKLNGLPSPADQCPVRRTLHGESTPSSDNEICWRKDLTTFFVEYTCTPIREAGEIGGAVVAFRDITQRRLLETQLIQAQKRESIGQLAAGVAHEINTPTQYIGDNTRFLQDSFAQANRLFRRFLQFLRACKSNQLSPQLLAEVEAAVEEADLEYLTEEIPKAIQQSLDGVERVATIVRSMKEFSHPGSQEKQAVDLNRAVENTLTVSRNEWKYVADVALELDPGLPPVYCMPGEINQVLLNLVINAAHAIAEKLGTNSTEKGTITIRTCYHGDWAEVHIQDTGTGIPEEIRSRVFDPFFTTKEVGRGTGQGLAIAHSIITEKHGGTLCLKTELGRGTTFIISLPLCEESSNGRGRQNAEADPVCR